MIWHSTLAMTVVDVLITSIAGCTLWVLYKRKNDLREPSAISGALLITLGVMLFGAFYFSDLFMMHGLPLFIPREDAMAVMRELHLNGSWLVALAAVGLIVVGFLLNNKHMLSLIDRLESTKRDLLEELAERKNAEDEARKSQKQLREAVEAADLANRAKSEFLANMSHELRTPLNAIIGFSSMAQRETFGPVGNPKYLEYVKDINESGTHLLALINDILDLSKIEAGQVELHEEAFDVSKAVGSCLHLAKERAETAGVTLNLDIADDLPALYADKRKLKQILINVLSNAIKFTPSGGKVTIRAWSRPDDGYMFRVADTGIGIALEDIPKALIPFQQIDGDLNRKYEGTGLGLPLTKSLVELHGGSLDLQSEVSVGTTVTVRIPAERIVRLRHCTKALVTGDRKAG